MHVFHCLANFADPTYMIRAIPSNAADNVYCTLLAQSGIHGAMAGYTGFTVGPVNGRHCYIPITVCSMLKCAFNGKTTTKIAILRYYGNTPAS